MSPLWPDLALARAAWAKAVENGLVDKNAVPANETLPKPKRPAAVRMILRRPVKGFAL